MFTNMDGLHIVSAGRGAQGRVGEPPARSTARGWNHACRRMMKESSQCRYPTQPQHGDLAFRCRVAGVPAGLDSLKQTYFDSVMASRMDPCCVIGCIAGLDAWRDAGLGQDPRGPVDWDAGVVFGFGMGAFETV